MGNIHDSEEFTITVFREKTWENSYIIIRKILHFSILKDHTDSSGVQKHALESLKERLSESEAYLKREQDAYRALQVRNPETILSFLSSHQKIVKEKNFFKYFEYRNIVIFFQKSSYVEKCSLKIKLKKSCVKDYDTFILWKNSPSPVPENCCARNFTSGNIAFEKRNDPTILNNLLLPYWLANMWGMGENKCKNKRYRKNKTWSQKNKIFCVSCAARSHGATDTLRTWTEITGWSTQCRAEKTTGRKKYPSSCEFHHFLALSVVSHLYMRCIEPFSWISSTIRFFPRKNIKNKMPFRWIE